MYRNYNRIYKEIIDEYQQKRSTNRVPAEYQRGNRVPAEYQRSGWAGEGAAAASTLLLVCSYSVGIMLVLCWYSIAILVF